MKDHFPNRLVFHICMFTLGYIPIKPHKTPTIPYSRAKRITINPHQIRIEPHWTPSNSKKPYKIVHTVYISIKPKLEAPKIDCLERSRTSCAPFSSVRSLRAAVVQRAVPRWRRPWRQREEVRWHRGDTAVSGAADVGMGLEATNWWGFKHHKWWKAKLSHFFNPWNMCNMGYVQLG